MNWVTVSNFIMENWHFLLAVLAFICSLIMGTARYGQLIEEVKELYYTVIYTVKQIKEILEDGKIDKTEVKQIKELLKKIEKEFTDIILLFREK